MGGQRFLLSSCSLTTSCFALVLFSSTLIPLPCRKPSRPWDLSIGVLTWRGLRWAAGGWTPLKWLYVYTKLSKYEWNLFFHYNLALHPHLVRFYDPSDSACWKQSLMQTNVKWHKPPFRLIVNIGNHTVNVSSLHGIYVYFGGWLCNNKQEIFFINKNNLKTLVDSHWGTLFALGIKKQGLVKGPVYSCWGW